MKMLQQIKRLVFLRRYLPSLAAGFLVVSAYPGFLRPMFQSMQASVREQNFRSFYEKRLSAMEQVSGHMENQRNRLREWQAACGSKIFYPSDAERFFASLEERAGSARCRLAAVEYEGSFGSLPASGSGAGVQMRGVRVQMFGSYEGWIQWVEQIESLPECVLLDSLRLEVQKDRPGLLSGRASLCVPVKAVPPAEAGL